MSKTPLDRALHELTSENVLAWNEFRCGQGAQIFDLAELSVSGVDLTGANLRSCDMSRAVIIDCDLSLIKFDAATRFPKPSGLLGCKLDRQAADFVKSQHSLCETDLAGLEVFDPIANLRLKFSGLCRWVHGIAVALWLLPYGWFIAKTNFLTNTLGVHENESATLLCAVLHRIVTGGKTPYGEYGSWWTVAYSASFLFALGYNTARSSLLWKVTLLERERGIRGVEPDFPNRDFWLDVAEFVRWGFKWNLAAVATLTFMDSLATVRVS